MGAEEEGVRAGEGAEQLAAGGLGLPRVAVDAGADGGVGELDGMVDAVAGDQRRPAPAGQLHGDVAGSVARRRGQAQAGGDLGALGRDVDRAQQTRPLDRAHGVTDGHPAPSPARTASRSASDASPAW